MRDARSLRYRGIASAYLNELSPGPVRAIFPGPTGWGPDYVAERQAAGGASERYSGGLRTVLAGTVVVALVTLFGKEKAGMELKVNDSVS